MNPVSSSLRAMICRTPLGPAMLLENGSTLTHLVLGRDTIPAGIIGGQTQLLTMAASQLQEYCEGRRQRFELPLAPAGTPFQQKIWQAAANIPYGTTTSYSSIAETIGHPRACRAAGQALKRNPISIIIPCHRVVGADGKLTGYAGSEIDSKEILLQLELRFSKN